MILAEARMLAATSSAAAEAVAQREVARQREERQIVHGGHARHAARRAGRCRRDRRRRPRASAQGGRRAAGAPATSSPRCGRVAQDAGGEPRRSAARDRPGRAVEVGEEAVVAGAQPHRGGGCAGIGPSRSAAPAARERPRRRAAYSAEHPPVELECLGRGRVPVELLALLTALLALGLGQVRGRPGPFDAVGDRLGVEGVDQRGGAARHLLQRRAARADDGQAGGHGLGHGQAEALLQRGQHQRGGGGHQRADLARLQVAGGADLRCRRWRRPGPSASRGPPGPAGARRPPRRARPM